MTNQRKQHFGYYSVAIFICLAVVASQICEILQKFELIAVQGHPSSLILVSIESANATFYYSLIVNMDVSLIVFEILMHLARK